MDAMVGLVNLQWSQQPSRIRPLPSHIERKYVSTDGGDLELLISRPKRPSTVASPPIFFAHGGIGSAGVWLEWMEYLHKSGYPGTLYAGSIRNHGASYPVPYLQMVYRTSFEACVDDVLACLKHAQSDVGGQPMVLVGHSSGGGIAQYILSQGLAQTRGLCLVDAIPHFGSYGLYWNWFKHDPWFPLRSILHLQHPNSLLSTPNLVHGAFFGSSFPQSRVPEFMQWMAPYESMGWPMGMAGDFSAWRRDQPSWLSVHDILRNIECTDQTGSGDRICILIGGEDMMFDPTIYERQVAEYRQAIEAGLPDGGRDGVADHGFEKEVDGASVSSSGGVRLVVIKGAGHHVQNDVQCDVAADALINFLEQL